MSIDDDDIETSILVRSADVSNAPSQLQVSETPVEASVSQANALMDVDVPLQHGQTDGGDLAFCQKSSDGLIDCQACLSEATSTLLQGLQHANDLVTDTKQILDALRGAGSDGLTKEKLMVIRIFTLLLLSADPI